QGKDFVSILGQISLTRIKSFSRCLQACAAAGFRNIHCFRGARSERDYFAGCGGFSGAVGEMGIAGSAALADGAADSAGATGADCAAFPEPPPLRKRIAVAARPSSAPEPLPPVTRISGTNLARPSDSAAMTL